jgi:hypothetical protein
MTFYERELAKHMSARDTAKLLGDDKVYREEKAACEDYEQMIKLSQG